MRIRDLSLDKYREERVMDTARSSITAPMEEAKSTAAGSAGNAEDAATSLAQKASDAASFVGKKADDAASAVGSGMKSLGETIRDKAPQKGPLGAAGTAVADTLETGGRYLKEHGLSGIGADLTNVIKRNPIPAVLVGIGLGFLIAHAAKRS
jgi:hypothetical protein